MATTVDWPDGIERTPPEQRESGNKFSVNWSPTRKEIRKEMERMGVDQWRIDHITGSGGDPGVVLRFTLDGADHAVACDGYTTKKANLRELYLWVNETRMRDDREAEGASDSFAAARLPSGDGPSEDDPLANIDPYDVLGVQPGASENIIETVLRQRKAEEHPDNGGDDLEFRKVKKAGRMLLEDE